LGGEQQSVWVQALQHRHSVGDVLHGGPRVGSLHALGDLVAVLVAGAFPVPPSYQPQIGDRVVLDAAPLEVEDLAAAHSGQVGHDDQGGGTEESGQGGCLGVLETRCPPRSLVQPAGDGRVQKRVLTHGQTGRVDDAA